MNRKMTMGKVFIIAEAGVNHNGSVDLAYQMIDVAVGAGVDAIKFQTFCAEEFVTKYALKANYQKSLTSKNETQLEMLKRLELPPDAYRNIKKHCDKKGIIFMSTPFDLNSVDLLNSLGMSIFKIPSGEITNLPYLRKIGALNKKIIMSTGMSDLQEIKKALDELVKSGTKKVNITVLHCNTGYPTPIEDVNLLAMLAIKRAADVNVGFSDHTLGMEASIAAVALGSSVIEKHFTLNRELDGPDHKASLEPHELKRLVTAIRKVEKMLGDGVKKVTQSELKNKQVARKSIVAAKDLKKGDIFTEYNIKVKRPGTGLSPIFWDKIIGKKARRNFQEDELIEL